MFSKEWNAAWSMLRDRLHAPWQAGIAYSFASPLWPLASGRRTSSSLQRGQGFSPAQLGGGFQAGFAMLLWALTVGRRFGRVSCVGQEPAVKAPRLADCRLSCQSLCCVSSSSSAMLKAQGACSQAVHTSSLSSWPAVIAEQQKPD